jgi:outer membrane protein
MKNGFAKIFFCLILIFFISSSLFAQTEKKILNLDDCIKIALRNNINVIIADNSYKSSKQGDWSAWGGLLPKVGSSLGYSHHKIGPSDRVDPVLGQFTTEEYTTYTYSAGLSVSENLSLGGMEYFNILSQKASKNSFYNNLKVVQQNIILQVKQIYFALLQAEMLLEVQNEALKRAEEQLKMAQAKFDLGSASLSDVLKAKVLYGNEELLLITYTNQVKTGIANLNYILGQDVNTELEIERNIVTPEPDYAYEKALEYSFSHHPSVLKAENDVKSARYDYYQSLGAFLPNLSLSYNYSWSNQDLNEIKNIGKKNYSWSLGASISLNLFNGFQNKVALSTSKLSLKTKQKTWEDTKNQVSLQVKEAYLSLQQSKEKMRVSADALKSAEEDFNLTKEKYNLGAASMLELLDSNYSLKNAQNNKVQAQYDYYLSVAQFEKAMGKGF